MTIVTPIILTTDQRIERLAISTADELRRIAAINLDGVPVETSVIFGDRAVEIGVEAECFNADLVVMPLRRRGPVAWITRARTSPAGGPVRDRGRRPARLGASG